MSTPRPAYDTSFVQRIIALFASIHLRQFLTVHLDSSQCFNGEAYVYDIFPDAPQEDIRGMQILCLLQLNPLHSMFCCYVYWKFAIAHYQCRRYASPLTKWQ